MWQKSWENSLPTGWVNFAGRNTRSELLQSTKWGFWSKATFELLPKCQEHIYEAESQSLTCIHLEGCRSRRREDHSEKGPQRQFPSGLSISTKTGFKLSFQLYLFGPFRRNRVVSGPTKPEQPKTRRTTKTWTACDTHLSSRSQPRLLALPTGL